LAVRLHTEVMVKVRRRICFRPVIEFRASGQPTCPSYGARRLRRFKEQNSSGPDVFASGRWGWRCGL